MQHVAQGLASLGRGNDKMLVHMTPGEVKGLQSLAMAHGGSLTINPHTGLPEAGFLSSILPMALGIGLTAATGLPAWQIGLGVGGVTALASGDLRKGLQTGLGAYGGAGLGESLASFGGEMGANMGPQLPAAAAAPTSATAAELARAGFNPEGLPLAANSATAAAGASMPTNFGIDAAPVVAPQPPATMAELASNQGQMPGMDALRSNKADYMWSGAKQAVDQPMNFLGTKGVPTALASAAAPVVSNTLSGMIQPQGIQGIVPQMSSAPNYPNYSFQQTRNPNWGQPGQPYYIQNYVKMAGGGQVPSPSLPLDLSQNYPGSNITKSSYATLPSTDSQEVVDGYGPKINPFTGAEGMASGGLAGGGITPVVRDLVMQIEKQGIFGSPQTNAQGGFDAYGSPPGYTYDPQVQQYVQQMASGGLSNLADFKMYSDKNEDSGVEDFSPTQLEAAADSDDPYLMGLASLERDRRRGSGTKGYKKKEFAHGGLADMPEYAAGGKLLRGPGDGMSDDIPAVIKGPKPQRAALADGEFVVPADVVSHLGNGSTEAGAKRLYSMMDKVRHARTGNKKQGRQINAERFLPA